MGLLVIAVALEAACSVAIELVESIMLSVCATGQLLHPCPPTGPQ